MSTSKKFNPPNSQSLEITVDEKDFLFRFKLDPREYFYPGLLVGPYSKHDYAYWEEYGMSEEKYEEQKKINKMLQDKKYEELLKANFSKYLQNFLSEIEYEARSHYEDGESLEQKITKDEDIVFKLIEKQGPNILRHNAIVDKIQDWCNEGDFEKIVRIATALKAYRKNIFGYISYSYIENRYLVVSTSPYILIKMREMREEITKKIKEADKEIKKKKRINDDTGEISKKITLKERNQKISKEIIDKWRIKQKEGVGRIVPWFDILLELAKKEEKKDGTDFVSFIKFKGNYSKDLLLLIYQELIHKSPGMVRKIIRETEKVLKMGSKARENVGHGF